MLSNLKRKFLFKCDDCESISNIEFETEEDLKEIDEDKMLLECSCGGISYVLRN